jgi:hypothetical protein
MRLHTPVAAALLHAAPSRAHLSTMSAHSVTALTMEVRHPPNAAAPSTIERRVSEALTWALSVGTVPTVTVEPPPGP